MKAAHAGGRRLEIAVLLDSPDENWPSMDLVGEMLLQQWATQGSSYEVTPTRLSIRIPPIVRRLPGARSKKSALNADRALARYLGYPVRAALARSRSQFFHVVDHSYAHLVHVLPASRTGVYCHDLDVVAPLLERGRERAAPWRLVLARFLAAGLRSAAVVFHNSREVGAALRASGLVAPSRLVHAPLGVAPEFHAGHDPADRSDQVLASLDGRPFVLHVGSEIRRKRIDVAFEVFAALRAKWPALRLVQQGASLSSAQRAHVAALGIGDALVQPPRLDRSTLAGLYRRASAVVVTSEAEGFGLPVIEAMACGAAVVASDIPVLREVGGDAALYAPVGDIPAWAELVDAVLARSAAVPSAAVRIRRAGAFSWARHAQIILEAYEDLRR
jgi:glycosyltransferase involved in cell wall biosynthesis